MKADFNCKEQMKYLKEKLKTMNFAVLKDSIEEVDRKLSILFKNIEYEKYLDFIKSNQKLNEYDNILGMFQNNLYITKNMVNALPESFIEEVDDIVKKKLDELKITY